MNVWGRFPSAPEQSSDVYNSLISNLPQATWFLHTLNLEEKKQLTYTLKIMGVVELHYATACRRGARETSGTGNSGLASTSSLLAKSSPEQGEFSIGYL